MNKLRGKKPEQLKKRIKMFLYGKAGIGKTIAALKFPKAYIIDLEKGTENYTNIIKQADSVVFSSNDPEEIRKEMETLLTAEHDYRTLVIDPVTLLYQGIQEIWSKKFAQQALASGKAKKIEAAEMGDFGFQYWGKVKRDYKALQRLILRLDMNVIVTAHQKDVYGEGFTKLGVTFDSMKDDDYFYDFVFRLEKGNTKKERIAITEKERAEPDKNKFPDEFPWSYENFLKFYGQEEIERKPQPIPMAKPEQVQRIKQLIEIIKIDDDVIEKWFRKADVDEWSEFTSEQINKCIAYCEDKMQGLKTKETEDDIPDLPIEQEKPKKRGRPSKKATDNGPRQEMVNKVLERLNLLEVEAKDRPPLVLKIASQLTGREYDEGSILTMEELEQIYAFLYQVKMGAEKELNTFRTLWEEV
jgi:tRNA(Ile)-lysidine synthase TilS/MesJ